MFQPSPTPEAEATDLLRVLGASEGSHPLAAPVTDTGDLLQICQWILKMRLQGRSNRTVATRLRDRLALSSEEAGRLVTLAEMAGGLAAETTDRQSDPSDAVASLVEEGLDIEFSVALINACINLFHDVVEEASRGEHLAFGVDAKAAEAYFAAADYVLDCLEVGRSRAETARKLIEKEIFPRESAAGFVDEVLLAQVAGQRIDAGEDGREVFEDLELQEGSPYVMLLALRLRRDTN